jgi:hypothetical protein
MYDPSALYVDPILTNFSVGWEDQNLYGLRLFPETPVRTPSGQYRVFDRSDWLWYRSLRAPGTVANEVMGRKWSVDTFQTIEHALQSPVFDEERRELTSLGGLANSTFGGDLTIDPERDATELVTRSLRLEHEKKIADTIRLASNYPAGHTVTLTGNQKWSDYTYVTAGDPNSVVSNPIADLRTAARAIYKDTGRWPNTMIMPFDAVGVIENHPRVVVRFQNFALSVESWKPLIGLPTESTDWNMFVVDSKYNSADNIDATENIVSFWGQDVWLGLVDPTPGQKTMTFGKTFAQVYPDGTTRPTERWREEARKSDLVRTNWKYDTKIVSGAAGYLIKTAVVAV